MTQYVELHCHSHYSLLDGASSPAQLAQRAAALGYPALALTDHNALYGAVEFTQAARAAGIRPIYGAELTLDDDSHLLLLVEDATGWANLCQLITLAQANAPKGSARLPADALAAHADGLFALSGCRQGAVARALRAAGDHAALRAAHRLLTTFGRDRCYIELQHHLRPDDGWLVKRLAALAGALDLPVVATNNVHYAEPAQRRLQDVLVCIRHNTPLDASEALRRPNAEYHLKSAAAMQQRFAGHPQAVANSGALAARCRHTLDFGLQHLPDFPTPQRTPPIVYLRELCDAEMRRRPNYEQYRDQLLYELGVIERAGYSNYFLIVWDIMRWAREQGIRCQGRGSAANSLTAYLLGIAPVNPFEQQLVFERFLSDDRRAVPDIDVDFDNGRREEVIQYVYRRYGAEHVALACTFSTYHSRSAVRDISKVFALPAADTLRLLEQQEAASERDWSQAAEDTAVADSAEQPAAETLAAADDPPSTTDLALLLDLVNQLKGIPRHLGQHSGGMVLMRAPLATRLPVEPAAMADRSVVQWDKDALETAGIAKIDVLGLGILAALTQAEQLIQPDGAPVLPTTFDDPAVYALASEADVLGVFQIESRAQAQVLPKLRPQVFNDLIITISLIRPGPLQGGMVHPFLRRRMGLEPVAYAHPLLEDALAETLGVIIFQEQVLKVARDLAGFSAGQGELLRRALGKKDAYAAIEAFRAQFMHGAAANGVPAAVAATVFDQLRAFGGYSFAKAHASAFAVLVYQSAWLRRYHPAALYCALLNCQPMGFWSPATLLGDARRHGIETLPVHIKESAVDCTLVRGDDGRQRVRLGFKLVKGFSATSAARLVAERERQPFRDVRDLAQRSGLARRLVEHLIAAGALDDWGARRELLWQLGRLPKQPPPLALPDDDAIVLPPLDALTAQQLELRMTGVTTGPHPLARLRSSLPPDVLTSAQLAACRPGQRVRTVGLIVVRQAPPTARGMRFYTAEDEFGLANWVLRPAVYARYRAVAHHDLLLAEGVIERDGQTNVVVWRVCHFTPYTVPVVNGQNVPPVYGQDVPPIYGQTVPPWTIRPLPTTLPAPTNTALEERWQEKGNQLWTSMLCYNTCAAGRVTGRSNASWASTGGRRASTGRGRRRMRCWTARCRR